MRRNSGPTFIGWGLALLVLGLIAAFAIADRFSGVDLKMIGYILSGVGAVATIIGVIMSMSGGKSSATTVVEPTVNGGTVRTDDVRHDV